MKPIRLDEGYFKGAVALENAEDGIRPWRLPIDEKELYDPALMEKAGCPAGVRVAFESETTKARLEVTPSPDAERKFDAVVDGALTETVTLPAGASIIEFEHLPKRMKTVEIYLAQAAPVTIRSFRVDEEATVERVSAQRPRWITYGSSITQCKAAASPALTWPAIVAREKGWDLTCLGFGGQCHLEPMMARLMRDLPADVISLCLGINVNGNGSLNLRTFRSAAIGMIKIIREKHTDTPVVVMSPIVSPPRETTANAVGMNLQIMREELQEAVRILKSYGDRNLYYIDGLDIFGQDYASYLPDQLHPDAEGYKIMAKHLSARFEALAL